jgi:predicted dienelactone hydrolase
MNRNFCQWLACSLGAIALSLGLASPGRTADRIQISLGILSESVTIDSLTRYANTGEITTDLRDFIRFANRRQRQDFRRSLTSKADLSVIAVSQFLYSPQGEALLRRLGGVLQSESGLSGFSGLRAALILAAADPDGLTLLNVIQKFPTDAIRIDIERGLQMAQELSRLVKQGQRANKWLREEALTQVNAEAPLPTGLSDLRLPGTIQSEKRTLTLTDDRRNRTFPVDLYLPVSAIDPVVPRSPAPLVVISHGLGSDRATFGYLAKHLASHGYAIAVMEHPGSNAGQIQSLINGRADEVAEPTEFVDRPRDVSYMLDVLAQDVTLNARLNAQQVTVIGQSFGGYTALALGGAQLDPKTIAQDCATLERTWNVSLFLQCQISRVKPLPTNLRDPRVKAVMAINPIASAVFGSGMAQLQVPTLIVAGDSDTIAPALSEQVLPFSKLTGPSRYLAVMHGGTHFSTIDETGSRDAVALPPIVIGPDLAQARRYINALALAFCRDPNANPHLTSRYAQSLSQGKLELSLLKSVDVKALLDRLD